MDKNFADYTLCNDNWEKLQELWDIGEHLNSIERWFEADQVPEPEVLEAIHDTAAAAGILAARLIALQIKLLEKL